MLVSCHRSVVLRFEVLTCLSFILRSIMSWWKCGCCEWNRTKIKQKTSIETFVVSWAEMRETELRADIPNLNGYNNHFLWHYRGHEKKKVSHPIHQHHSWLDKVSRKLFVPPSVKQWHSMILLTLKLLLVNNCCSSFTPPNIPQIVYTTRFSPHQTMKPSFKRFSLSVCQLQTKVELEGVSFGEGASLLDPSRSECDTGVPGVHVPWWVLCSSWTPLLTM